MATGLILRGLASGGTADLAYGAALVLAAGYASRPSRSPRSWSGDATSRREPAVKELQHLQEDR